MSRLISPSGNAETSDDRMARMVASSMRTYDSHRERAALRCAMGDAAHICDMIGSQLREDMRGRGGKGAYTILGNQLSAVAKTCGDKIWALREQITFEDEDKKS